MIFQQLGIAGVWRVELETVIDDRGFFARTFCSAEFAAHGLPEKFEQISVARNSVAGTLRGMHYQPVDVPERKLVRCVRGAIYDVVVDVRPGSDTRGQWLGQRLDAESGMALYIEAGLAHGYVTLDPDSDVLYQITPSFAPGNGAGVRWDDPAFGIEWPIAKPFMSVRDATYPDWLP